MASVLKNFHRIRKTIFFQFLFFPSSTIHVVDDTVYEMKKREYISANIVVIDVPDENTRAASAGENMGISKE